MLKKIAVTGGVASGKTTVCRIFEELGASVVFADAVVHELLKSDTDLGKKVVREFGPEIVKNGQIDRKILGNLVFKDAKALKKLESLIHPAVLKRVDEEYKMAKGTSFVVEIPLLYEIGAEEDFDIVIAVACDEQIAKKRFAHGEKEYDLRMQQQLKPEIKAARAHYTITNNGTLEDLRHSVIRINRIIHSTDVK